MSEKFQLKGGISEQNLDITKLAEISGDRKLEDILNQAKQYQIDATYHGRAHYKAADIASQWQNRLGIPVVVITSIVATSIFATISSNPAVVWKLAAGLLSVLAAVLSALQTFFKFSKVAETHRSAGASYGAVRRELDIFNLRYVDGTDTDRPSALKELDRISSRLSELASESPGVSAKPFRLAVKEIEGEQGKLPTSVARIHDRV